MGTVKETYTKEEVSKLLQKRVKRSHKAFFDRYSVKSLKELDNLVKSAQQKEEKEEVKTPEEFLPIVPMLRKKDVEVELKKIEASILKQKKTKQRNLCAICFSGDHGSGKSIAADIFTLDLYVQGFVKKAYPLFIKSEMIKGDKLDYIYRHNFDCVVVFENAYSMFSSIYSSAERLAFTNKLCSLIESNRGSVITIFSDTEENIQKMLQDSRLANTITNTIKFEPYNDAALSFISLDYLEHNKVSIQGEAGNQLFSLYKELRTRPNYMGVRTIINVLNKLIMIQGSHEGNEITVDDVNTFKQQEGFIRHIDINKEYVKKLDALVGLSNVKKQIKRMSAYAQKHADNVDNLNLHMCFLGNPGTGKTEVGKMFAGMLYENGVLPENKLIVATRTDLVAEYIGQTAPKVRKAVLSALGGVLFIDEAYYLASKEQSEKDFGFEALAELINCMEEYRGKFAVIFAGYKNETMDMIESNPGLKSRVSRFINFPNYSKEELKDIAKVMISQTQYTCSDGVIDGVIDVVETKRGNDDFANAREVRNVFESLYEIQAVRTIDNKSFNIIQKDLDVYIKENNIKSKKNKEVSILETSKYLKDLYEHSSVDELNTKYIEDRTVLVQEYKDGKLIGEGTGFIISDNGLVVTNEHVVNGANEIKVRKTLFLDNGQKIYKTYGADVYRTNKDRDVALIVIKDKDYTLPYFTLSENRINELSPIMMGGYPFGANRLNNISFNEGSVQSYNKDVYQGDKDKNIERIYVDMSGVPGSSGSPVIDKQTGKVIGVFSGSSLNHKENLTSEINYAMPIEYIWDLLPKSNKKVNKNA